MNQTVTVTTESPTLERSGLVQRLTQADLRAEGARVFSSLVPPGGLDVVYSDPPWNPGNEKYWRRHASASAVDDRGYSALLNAWCACVVAARPAHVFCEQSTNDKHRALFVDAVQGTKGWDLPLLEEWTVYYGSPGSRGCTRPNKLLHFGATPIATDPTGMSGEPMTIRVFAGLSLPVGSWIGDPCVGKGMTSRMGHYFALNVVGTELNPKRLEYGRAWLKKRGYEEVSTK